MANLQPHSKVKLIREALGLSQEKFAEKIGIKQRTLSYIESGTYNINYQFLRHLIQSYGVNIDWFFNDRGELFEKNITRGKL
ncbi:MAG: helix-turn-helix transcriptional regulator [Arcobacter sp.]|uniref:helix-turn-helix domain-containing protein n=1 Tax=Arcobacter sp. TaxID=1872629 RepID=UPI002586B776|nr:helix-turn-helix transcriptional regulator [Arcobacter sp.]MDD3008869.1 helix-turn-helix transcriptional regulator [Arcobacter sp.]